MDRFGFLLGKASAWGIFAGVAIMTFVNCGGTTRFTRTGTSRQPVVLPASADLEILNPISLEKDGEPVLDSPDPNVYEHDGKYYLTYTPAFGNIPIFVSENLRDWRFLKYAFAEQDARMIGDALQIGSHYYCNVWAPELHDDDFGGVQLSFTAVRLSQLPANHRCPPYDQNGGIYVASSREGIAGTFAVQARTPHEPRPLAKARDCALDPEAPASPRHAFNSCNGGPCDAILRLDQTVFKDQGKTWLGYSWYTNSRPVNDWERENNGEHLSVTELDPRDDSILPCRPTHERIPLVNPHDVELQEKLKSSCAFCDQFLSFSTDREGRPFYPNGYLQGVAEGASFFRRGDWVYLLASGGVWDSATYNVFWIAAHSVEELAQSNPHRLVGRYLVPDGRYSFGHGSVVQTRDQKFYYVYHRLDHKACLAEGDCRRRLMISPIDFEEHGDANHDAFITARQPTDSDQIVHVSDPARSAWVSR